MSIRDRNLSNRSVRSAASGARPELELLLRCARPGWGEEAAGQIRALLQHELDWKLLLRTAEPHGLIPLLCWNLSNVCPDAVPQPVLEQLRSAFAFNAQRNLVLTRELLRLLNRLEEQGVSGVPFKGPMLAVTAYGDLTLRQMKDLDLMVPRRDVAGAWELLVSQGYQPNRSWTAEQKAAHLREGHDFKFIHERTRTTVELHWAFHHRHFSFRLDPERLRERLQPVSLAGTEVRHFAPEDLILILCAHGASHFWSRLLWISDVAHLVQAHPELDWDRTMRQARRLGSERILLLGLRLARDLLEISPPESLARRMEAEPILPSLAVHVAERLFRGAADRCREIEMMKERQYLLALREQWRDRLPYCVHLARDFLRPGEAERALLRLPPLLAPCYYMLRPVRLAGKYGLLMAKRLRQ